MRIQLKIGIIAILFFIGIVRLTTFFYNYSINIEKPFPTKIEKAVFQSKKNSKPIIYFGVISNPLASFPPIK